MTCNRTFLYGLVPGRVDAAGPVWQCELRTAIKLKNRQAAPVHPLPAGTLDSISSAFIREASWMGRSLALKL